MFEDIGKDFRYWFGIIRLERAIVAIVSKPKETKNLISRFLTLCILKLFQQEFESIRWLVQSVPLFEKVQDVLLNASVTPTSSISQIAYYVLELLQDQILCPMQTFKRAASTNS